MVTCSDADRRSPLYKSEPKLLVEVLSPSTAAFDRGDKFAAYRRLSSLQEYVLIAQDECHVEHYIRAEHGWWRFNEATDRAATIQLASIDCTLTLAEIYERVTFTEPGESRQ